MAHVDTSETVNVPVHTAYNQWTQFESFPRFMKGIDRVEQISDERVRFTGSMYGVERSWEAKILEQEPDRRVAWASTEGAPNSGTVTFEPDGPNRTRVNLKMEFEPEGMAEKTGDALGMFEARVKGDLDRFKEYIESRGTEEGAWRGEIDHGVSR